MTMAGSAVAAVRLALDFDERPGAFDEFNGLVDELDPESARVAVAELVLLVVGLLEALHESHPGIDPGELVARWGLRLALDGVG